MSRSMLDNIVHSFYKRPLFSTLVNFLRVKVTCNPTLQISTNWRNRKNTFCIEICKFVDSKIIKIRRLMRRTICKSLVRNCSYVNNGLNLFIKELSKNVVASTHLRCKQNWSHLETFFNFPVFSRSRGTKSDVLCT